MKKVYAARDNQEAHMVRIYLEGFGIETKIHGEMLEGFFRPSDAMTQGVDGANPFARPTIHTLNDEDYDRACELVKEYFDDHDEIKALPEWTCGECSEAIEGQFTHCWNCGAER